jgi:hypothetical protein
LWTVPYPSNVSRVDCPLLAVSKQHAPISLTCVTFYYKLPFFITASVV